MSPLIRDSLDTDVPAITALYRHHVLHSTGTFETEPPDETAMAARRQDVLRLGLPWLVAESSGRLAGFCYGNWFRPRGAFRYGAEDSIYLSPDATGKGIGSALLAEWLGRCERQGLRLAIAVVGDSDNGASLALHRRAGFQEVGRLHACGWKFGRWLDLVMMQRPLGAGAQTPPP